MDRHYTITHSGIKGMKWGIRRFRNYDDTLTEAGKKRYGDGGAKMIKKAEKERNRREKILSDSKKLEKYGHEFSKSELERALEKQQASGALKRQLEANKLDSEFNKLALKRMKSDWRTEQKDKRLQEAISKQAFNAKKASDKQALDAKKAAEKRLEQDQKDKRAEAAEKKRAAEKKQKEDKKGNKLQKSANKWENRAKKYKGMWETSTNAKSILDAMGITDESEGKSLFSVLGKALGFEKKKAPEKNTDAGSKTENETKKTKSEEDASVLKGKVVKDKTKKKTKPNRKANGDVIDIDFADVKDIVNDFKDKYKDLTLPELEEKVKYALIQKWK